MPTIENILSNSGPMLASCLAKQLATNSAAARKRIQRAGVHRVPVSFPHNDHFLYLPSQYKSEEYFNSLILAMKQSRSIFGVALSSMMARGGVVPLSHFAAISGSPERLKKHLGTHEVLAALEKLELIVRVPSDAGDLLVVRGYGSSFELNQLRARMVTEEILISYFSEWLKKTGLGSWGKVMGRSLSVLPKFGQFSFDITAPSYMYPFKTHIKDKVKPGFIVSDVVLGGTIKQDEVEYFIRKCSSLRCQKGILPFLGILLATRFSKEALMTGRRYGLIFVTPQSLFGQDIGRALAELLATLTNAAATASKRPEVVEDLFRKLSVIEGAVGNLRGPLFELIVGHCVQKKEGGFISIGLLAKDPGNPESIAEIDVLRVINGIEVCAYECRGKLSNIEVSEKEVKQWLEVKVPIIRSWLLSQPFYASAKHGFEIWTTGKFSPKAVAFLTARATNTKKFRIAWKAGADVLNYVRLAKAQSLINTLNEHYFRHPLAKH